MYIGTLTTLERIAIKFKKEYDKLFSPRFYQSDMV